MSLDGPTSSTGQNTPETVVSISHQLSANALTAVHAVVLRVNLCSWQSNLMTFLRALQG